MFMECNLINHFQIPYNVCSFFKKVICSFLSNGFQNSTLTLSVGSLSMGVKCEEKLQARQIPQLETRVKRGSDHVRYAQNGKNGKVHDGFRGWT